MPTSWFRPRYLLGAAVTIWLSFLGAAPRAQAIIPALEILHRFTIPGGTAEGFYPAGGSVQAADGAIYGATTQGGGSGGGGAAFRVTTGGAFTRLAAFPSSLATATNGLTLGPDGRRYALMGFPGLFTWGFVRVNFDGSATTLHTFTPDDGYPMTGLVLGRDGSFYFGGQSRQFTFNPTGSIMRIETSGSVSMVYPTPDVIQQNLELHSELALPIPRILAQGADGSFYVMNESQVVRLPVGQAPQRLTTVQDSLRNQFASITIATGGRIYLTGWTDLDTTQRHAAVFTVDGGGARVLHRFDFATEGGLSIAPLLEANDGNLYDASIDGGPRQGGTLFQPTPGGGMTVLYALSAVEPRTVRALLQGQDGLIYGASQFGGGTANICFGGCGTIFRFDVGLGGAPKVSGKVLGNPCDRPGGCTAGNPIDVATGNKFEQVTDYETAGPNTLGFTRYYNSMAIAGPTVFAGRLGIGWRHSFERLIHIGSATSVTVERADGRSLEFNLTAATWQPDTDVDLRLVHPAADTWVLTDSKDTLEVYRSITADRAVLAALRARNGYAQALSYNAAGALESVADSFGRSLHFNYADNLLQSLTTPDGLVVSFGYSASRGTLDRLATVTYSTVPAGTVTYLYERDAFPFAVTGIVNENGDRYATWEYDNSGRAFVSEHAGGADRMTVDYDDDGSRTVTNPLGLKLTYRFTTLQGVPKLTRVEREPTAFIAAATRTSTFDGNGYLASQTDWNGRRTAYTNDTRGLPTKTIEADGTPVARTTTYTYDANLHVPRQMVQPGLTTDFTYDAEGQLLTRTETDTTTTAAPYATAGTKRRWTFTWSGGLVTSVRGPRTGVAALTRFAYDATGALIRATNALGHETSVISHTPGGRPLAIVDANNVKTEMTYDARQRVTSSTVQTALGLRTTTYSYDRAGDTVTTTLPDGSALTNSYDAARRLTSITDLFNQRVAYTMDPLGNQTRTEMEDAGGTVARTQTAEFDALGRMVTSVSGMGQTSRYVYDGNGNRITAIDALGRATQDSYDALNRLTRTIDPAGGLTLFTYDPLDRVLSVTAPNGTTTINVYDGFGRRIQVLSPDSGKTVYRYDLAGNLTQVVDARGAIANNTFDALDRITTTTYPAAPAENVSYRYDEAVHGAGVGRLTSLTDAVGTLSRFYDERGSVLQEQRSKGGVTLTTRYGFDDANRLRFVTYPSGGRADYPRDAMGRVAGLFYTPAGTTVPKAVASNLTYLPFGPLQGLTFGNGIVEDRRFDSDYRVTDIAATGLALVQSLSYAYDDANNVRGIADRLASAPLQVLGYDGLDRLVNASGAYGTLAYSYDANGNRLSQTANGTLTTYSYTAGTNRLAQVKTGAALQAVAYTPSGNTSSVADVPRTRPNMGIEYNAGGQLSRVLAGGAVSMQNGYDAFGQRSFRTGRTTGTTFFQYDLEGHLVEDADGLGRGRIDYMYLDDRPIGTFQLGLNRLTFLHVDHLGTPKISTDAGQTVVWQGDAEPFGATTVNVGLASQNLRLLGQEYELDTGWHHNGFRDYLPSMGRYLQSDPVGLGGGTNTYAYASNAPIQKTDRLGLFSAYNHNHITKDAITQAGGSSCPDLPQLVALADWLPGSQDPRNAHWHAMRDGTNPKDTSATAKSSYDDFVAQQEAKCTCEGLARALHAIQDSFAGGHVGFQPWSGGLPGIGHAYHDGYPTKEERSSAVDASASVIEGYETNCKGCAQ